MIEDIFANVSCVIAVAEYDDKAVVIINDFDELNNIVCEKLIDIEDRYGVEISVKATQGRDPIAMFPGAKLR